MLHRRIQMVEEAVKSEPKFGVYFYSHLGHALHKTNQRAQAEEIFKVKKWDIGGELFLEPITYNVTETYLSHIFVSCKFTLGVGGALCPPQ